jgi:glycosyltransferase involved in cell wall biosynthesis
MCLMPKVSVIVPTWNRPELLRESLVSVLRQTEEDFEVLVIDDHSEHGAAEKIVRDLRDPRIQHIRQPEHRGVGAARNVGIAKATAAYIAFLDDDDEWVPEKLAVQLQALENSPPNVAGVYSARLNVNLETGHVSTTRCRHSFSPWRGNVITTSSLLVRRHCFDVVGVFDERLTAGGDWEMWLRIASRFRFEYIDQVLVKYSVHRESISRTPLEHEPSRELILIKHAELFSRHPRSFAGRYGRLGMRYYRHGDVANAQRAFRKAIRIWPFAVRAYWGLLLSWLSSRHLRRISGRAVRPGAPR